MTLSVRRTIGDTDIKAQQYFARKASVGIVEIHASASETITSNSDDFDITHYSQGLFTLDITASSGTSPTLDVKFQVYNGYAWVDLGEAFAQKSTTGVSILKVPVLYGHSMRAVFEIGGGSPDFTFSLVGLLK